MRFREFERQIRTLPVFDLNDVRKIDPGFYRSQLSDWVKRGYIIPLAGGYYFLADLQIDESLLFMMANLIYKPSYISRESALAVYGVIPESVLGVTNVSSRKTRRFNTRQGRFIYRSIAPHLMFGYRIIEKGRHTRYLIATPEKAILDYLYWNPVIQSVEDFELLRWSRDLAAGIESSSMFRKYLRVFNSRALDHRVEVLKEYIHA